MSEDEEEEEEARERAARSRIFGVTATTSLTKVEGALARAVARLDDHERIEAIFDVPSGTIARLMEVADFKALVEDTEETDARYSDPDVDFGRALDEKHRRGARLTILDELSQTKVAAALRVTTRTIRNWEGDLFYLGYCDQLRREKEAEEAEEREARRREKEAEETEEREARRREIGAIRDEIVLEAHRNLREALRTGGSDVAIAFRIVKEL